jgi:hypothetical protein
MNSKCPKPYKIAFVYDHKTENVNPCRQPAERPQGRHHIITIHR